MSKRSSSPSGSSRSLLGTILALIVVIVAAIVSLFSGGPQTPTSPPTVTPGGTQVAEAPGEVVTLSIPQGFGAEHGFWQVYFSAPTGSGDSSLYTGGIDGALASAIENARSTLDIAAFEFNNAALTKAVLDAKSHGVTVRMVTDNDSGIGDADTTINQFVAAGIPVVDDGRSGLMHDKFMIIDRTVVWTGSWNYTVNGTYRNNNNALMLRSQRAVQSYEAEFNEMFVDHKFGRTSPTGNSTSFTQDGIPIQILFGSEDNVVGVIHDELTKASSSIRFMAFSFTVDDLGKIIREKAAGGMQVQGIFETTGSETRFSELTPLFCAGLQVRQDGNPYVLHHKLFILDDQTVLTGSFNFSESAATSNDENMIIIRDPLLAAQYVAEFNRRWAEAHPPEGLKCS